MRRVETLRQQATLLRTLAQTFEEMPVIAKQAMDLATRCQDLADQAEREIKQRTSKPIASTARSARSRPPP